jgi:hypothetical protein
MNKKTLNNWWSCVWRCIICPRKSFCVNLNILPRAGSLARGGGGWNYFFNFIHFRNQFHKNVCFCENFFKNFLRFLRKFSQKQKFLQNKMLQKSDHFCMIFAFLQKWKKAFLFQPLLCAMQHSAETKNFLWIAKFLWHNFTTIR